MRNETGQSKDYLSDETIANGRVAVIPESDEQPATLDHSSECRLPRFIELRLKSAKPQIPPLSAFSPERFRSGLASPYRAVENDRVFVGREPSDPPVQPLQQTEGALENFSLVHAR